jgi:hypothetical protein
MSAFLLSANSRVYVYELERMENASLARCQSRYQWRGYQVGKKRKPDCEGIIGTTGTGNLFRLRVHLFQ